MSKGNPPEFVQKMFTDGTTVEKSAEKNKSIADLGAKVDAMIRKLPTNEPDRSMYLRELIIKSLKKEIDEDVFKQFVQRTNTMMTITQMLPRLKEIYQTKRGT